LRNNRDVGVVEKGYGLGRIMKKRGISVICNTKKIKGKMGDVYRF